MLSRWGIQRKESKLCNGDDGGDDEDEEKIEGNHREDVKAPSARDSER